MCKEGSGPAWTRLQNYDFSYLNKILYLSFCFVPSPVINQIGWHYIMTHLLFAGGWSKGERRKEDNSENHSRTGRYPSFLFRHHAPPCKSISSPLFFNVIAENRWWIMSPFTPFFVVSIISLNCNLLQLLSS